MKTPWRQWLAIGAIVLCGFPALTSASEVDALLNKLVQRGLLTASDAQEVRSEMNPGVAGHEKDTEAQLRKGGPEWAQRVSLNGDLRVRNEFRDRSNASDVNRQRIRFRLGLKAKVTDQLEVGARLATGSTPGDQNEASDPVSTNQTLSDTFAKKSVNLDQAYVKYSPDNPLGLLNVWGGIFENPFVASSLVWDSDVTFGGAALQWSQTYGPVQPFLNGGIFPIDSDSNSGYGVDNPTLFGIQGGLTFTPGLATGAEILDHVNMKTTLGYYDYTNVVKNAIINTQAGNTAAAEDFNELNPSVEIASQAFGGVPLAFWTDWVNNTSAPEQASGYQFGVRIGKATTPWDLKNGWEAGYFYQRLDADAAFDAFVDSDFGGGGTNHKGNVMYVTLATLKNSTASLKYYNADEVKGAKSHEDRLQVDWVTKF